MDDYINISDTVHTFSQSIREVNNKIVYVYSGICENKYTKWITLSEWNYLLKIEIDENGLFYQDIHGMPILCYEKGDDKYDFF